MSAMYHRDQQRVTTALHQHANQLDSLADTFFQLQGSDATREQNAEWSKTARAYRVEAGATRALADSLSITIATLTVTGV